MKKQSFKQWLDRLGLISVLWIMTSIIVFEIIFLTTSLERKDFFLQYILITMSVPIAFYLVNQYQIRIIRKKNRVKLHQLFEVIKIEYQTKEFKKQFLLPLEQEIPINTIFYDQLNSLISIQIGLIEKVKIEFGIDKATIDINELPVKISYYYKRVRKTDDWNARSNYRMLGTKQLYLDMLQVIIPIVRYGCIVEEYDIDHKNHRIVAHIRNVEQTKIFDSTSPYDKKANKTSWFKSKPKTYRISLK